MKKQDYLFISAIIVCLILMWAVFLSSCSNKPVRECTWLCNKGPMIPEMCYCLEDLKGEDDGPGNP